MPPPPCSGLLLVDPHLGGGGALVRFGKGTMPNTGWQVDKLLFWSNSGIASHDHAAPAPMEVLGAHLGRHPQPPPPPRGS